MNAMLDTMLFQGLDVVVISDEPQELPEPKYTMEEFESILLQRHAKFQAAHGMCTPARNTFTGANA
jgi:hypothetical protein